ncbi:MAG: divalent cation transporter [Candidatus Thermoplasmatota archaeon]|nr:divalent cation transporter [Candidatus Thermoplasmatota archaeon]
MNTLALVLLYTFLAGLAIPLGGLLARREHLRRGHFRQDLLHGIVAFGGGILFSAIALVLVPEGLERTTIPEFTLAFAGGAVVFLLIDYAVEIRGEKAGQVMAMTMDYVPESIALGAAFGMGGPLGPFLAFLIGFQNLPEGFNSYRELKESNWSRRRIFGLLAVLVGLGPMAGVLGFFLLAAHPRLISWLFLFAAGGILYGLFHDVAPLAHQRKHWIPTLGAILGFLLGMIGEALIGSL